MIMIAMEINNKIIALNMGTKGKMGTKIPKNTMPLCKEMEWNPGFTKVVLIGWVGKYSSTNLSLSFQANKAASPVTLLQASFH